MQINRKNRERLGGIKKLHSLLEPNSHYIVEWPRQSPGKLIHTQNESPSLILYIAAVEPEYPISQFGTFEMYYY